MISPLKNVGDEDSRYLIHIQSSYLVGSDDDLPEHIAISLIIIKILGNIFVSKSWFRYQIHML
jgi:hypothetical protein